MQYKTIVLELLQSNPILHEQLRRQRMLLPTMEFYASELRDSHLAWKEHLSASKPGSDASQITSQAMELALQDLKNSLPSDSSSAETAQPSLDDFLTVLRDRIPPA